MAFEYRVNWSGTHVTGPGTSVFHGRADGIATNAQSAQDFADRVKKFFDDVRTLLPGGITWDFPGEVTELNTTTGILEDVHTVTAPVSQTSSGTAGNHSRPSGARVDWLTNAIVNGRRLRGRTFLVPLAASGYDSTGTLASGTLTTLGIAATNYRSTGVFTRMTPAVWSRTHGILGDITGANLDDRASVLRSRRD